jgi:hypothetical protein
MDSENMVCVYDGVLFSQPPDLPHLSIIPGLYSCVILAWFLVVSSNTNPAACANSKVLSVALPKKPTSVFLCFLVVHIKLLKGGK